MKIEGSERVALAPDVVWQGLNTPRVLQASTPGLVRLDETAPDHFEATLEIRLPAVSGRFEGTLDIVEREAPSRMKVKLKGKGAPGFVDGGAELFLAAAEGGTQVRYSADVQVGGQVARVGQRMLSGVSKEMAGQFFET
ncbi:MAG: CoxG family protein, partial [Myxococcota bacterium]